MEYGVLSPKPQYTYARIFIHFRSSLFLVSGEQQEGKIASGTKERTHSGNKC